MEIQIYNNLKEKIEVYIGSKTNLVMSSIHPISRSQIVLLPEGRINRGTEREENELKKEIKLLINRKDKTDQIVDEIMTHLKSFVYSSIP